MKILRIIQALMFTLLTALAAIVGLGIPPLVSGCAAFQKGAAEVVPVLTKISDAAQYLDAAWSAFCLFKPSICQQYGAEYQKARGILAASLLAARDTTEAVATGKIDDVRTAYKAIEELLLKLGIVVPAGTVGAPKDGWTPWEAPRI